MKNLMKQKQKLEIEELAETPDGILNGGFSEAKCSDRPVQTKKPTNKRCIILPGGNNCSGANCARACL
jgi:hypothetical protein